VSGPAGEVLFLVDDVDAEAERLRALGVELLSGPVDLTEDAVGTWNCEA
jgi:lactoylglutathione lyase